MLDGSQPGSAVVCDPTSPTLKVGEDVTCTAAAYAVTAGDVVAGSPIVNTATVTGTPPRGDPVTDTSDVSTPTHQPPEITPDPAISLVKTETLNDVDTAGNTAGKADEGETITYSFVVTNKGNVTLTDVAVADAMLDLAVGGTAVSCGATPVTLAPDDDVTCTADDYTVTSTDVVEGVDITNVATASGAPPTGDRVTGTGQVSTPTQKPAVAPHSPAISVVKTYALSGTDNLADAGETITYSFLVTNIGDMTLYDVSVVDPMLDGSASGSAVSCALTTLVPGGPNDVGTHVTCTTPAYTVSAGDVADGRTIFNTATATGMTSNEDTIEATDEARTPTRKPTQPGGTVDPTVQPKITLKAAVVNDAGGTSQVSDFILTGSSIEVTHEGAVQNSAAMVASAVAMSFSGVTGAAAITNAVVPVGTYFLSESALPSGYSASAWACTGGQLNGSAITVALGNTVECLITNTYSSTVVDSPGVPTGHPASPPAAVLAVDKAAPDAKAPTAKAPTAATPTVTTLAFTGAEPVPLSLLALLALVLGVALTVAGRRQGGQRGRE